jgi:hypothetical protein
METCETPIFPTFEDISQCSAPASPASRQVLPGSAEVRAMTVGSGQQCAMLLEQSSPLGAFSKILLESCHWTNSEEYCYVWNRLDTRFALSAFRLTPWGQSTDENECSLLPTPIRKDAEEGSGKGHHLNPEADYKAGWRLKEAVTMRLWLTPNTFDSLELKIQEALDHEAQVTKAGKEPNNLRDQVAVRMGLRLWRTPNGSDVTGGPMDGERKLAQGHQLNLVEQAKTSKLWPTPRAEFDSGKHRGSTDTLHSAAKLWPTPQAHDCHQGNAERVGRFGTKHGGRNLCDEVMIIKNRTSWIGSGHKQNPTTPKLWRTPTSADSIGIKSQEALNHEAAVTHAGVEPNKLSDQVAVRAGMRLWPTPTERDWKSTSQNGNQINSRPLSEVAGKIGKELPEPCSGSLNPEFVERLMMFPIGHTRLLASESAIDHTDLKRSATP